MPDWIAQANIDHFKQLLETKTAPQKRVVIKPELAEEETKLATLKNRRKSEKED